MSIRRPSSWLRGLVIIVLGIAVGLAANLISPRGLPLFAPASPTPAASEFIPLDQAKSLWLGGTALFLDAREPDDFAAGHIGNALNLPAQSFSLHFPEVAPVLSPDSELVLYCDGKECELSHHLAANLRQQGFTNLHVLANGWTAWHEAGLPTTIGGQK
jgi:rhodanese-related sulfurtransferase